MGAEPPCPDGERGRRRGRESLGPRRREARLALGGPHPLGDPRAGDDGGAEGARHLGVRPAAALPLDAGHGRGEGHGEDAQRLRLHPVLGRRLHHVQPVAAGGAEDPPGPAPRALHHRGVLRRRLPPPRQRRAPAGAHARQPHRGRRGRDLARPRPDEAVPRLRHFARRGPPDQRVLRLPVLLPGAALGGPALHRRPPHGDHPAAGGGAALGVGRPGALPRPLRPTAAAAGQRPPALPAAARRRLRAVDGGVGEPGGRGRRATGSRGREGGERRLPPAQPLRLRGRARAPAHGAGERPLEPGAGP